MSKKVLIWFLLILLIGSTIRFYNPTFRSLWGDEAHSFFMAQQITPQSFFSGTGKLIKDSHLPAYFTLLSAWMGIFGCKEYALRSFSILIGILGLIVFFIFSRKLFDEETALVSMLLLVISPLAVMHSQEIRMYGLLFLLATLSSLCFWQLVSGKRSVLNSAGYFVFTLLLVLTHIYGALVIAAQFLYLLLDCWRGKKTTEFVHLFILQIFVGILVIPIYSRMFFLNLLAVISETTDMAFSVFPWYLKLPLFFFVLSLGETVAPWNVWIVLPAVLVFGALFLRSFKWFSDERVSFLLVLCLFPLFFSALFLKPTMPKYLIISLPFYLLLISYSILQVRKGILKIALVLILVVVQFFSIYNYFNFKEYHNSNQMEPWREVAALIRSKYHKGDVILSSTHFVVYRILNYYLNVADRSNIPIYDLEEVKLEVNNEEKPTRIWLVTNIHDDRAFPAGFIEALVKDLERNYKPVMMRAYIPYEDTLVSKLPIQRHAPGSNRITVKLYEKKWYNIREK